jgi:hypothetical protein
MTACLRCDGCYKAAAEHESDLRKWWRLTRHGIEFAEEPVIAEVPFATVPFSMDSTFIAFQIDDNDDDDDEAIADVVMADGLDDDEPSSAVLHFCSSACLDSWASQAAALE